MRDRLASILFGLAFVSSAGACQAILGIEDLAPGASGENTGGAGGRGGSSSDGGGGSGGGGPCTPVVENCSTPADDNCDGKKGCTGDAVWNKLAATTSDDTVDARIAVDRSGDVIVVGSAQGQVAIGKQVFYGEDFETFAFIAKFSAKDGAVKLFKDIHAKGDVRDLEPIAIAAAPNGDVIVGGRLIGSVLDVSADADSGFVMSVNGETGEPSWIRAQTSDDYMVGTAVIQAVDVSADGDVIAGGSLTGTVQLSNGGDLTASAEADGYWIRTNADGDAVKTKLLGSGAQDADCSAVAFVPDGSGDAVAACVRLSPAFTLGSTEVPESSARNGVLTRLDPELAATWVQVIKSDGDEFLGGLRVDRGGRVVLGGTFDLDLRLDGRVLMSDGGFDDIFVAALKAEDGSLDWMRRYGDASDQVLIDLTVDDAGQIVIAGEFAGEISTTSCMISSRGGAEDDRSDAFVIKLAPNGDGIWCTSGGRSDYEEFTSGVVDDALGNVYAVARFDDVFTFRGGHEVQCKVGRCSTAFSISRLDP